MKTRIRRATLDWGGGKLGKVYFADLREGKKKNEGAAGKEYLFLSFPGGNRKRELKVERGKKGELIRDLFKKKKRGNKATRHQGVKMTKSGRDPNGNTYDRRCKRVAPQ